jgi:hypothetical protein
MKSTLLNLKYIEGIILAHGQKHLQPTYEDAQFQGVCP